MDDNDCDYINIPLTHRYFPSDPPGLDFSVTSINVTIPAASRTFEIPTFFTIFDDNIDEDEQSFAIFAEILNVPETISCFQTHEGGTVCFGQQGVTEIRISDNDRKLSLILIKNLF